MKLVFHSPHDFNTALGKEYRRRGFIRGDESLRPAEDALREAKLQIAFPEDSRARLIRRGILVCSQTYDKCQFTMDLPQA